MGQFFTTVNPNFIEDALYQSPLDLAEKLLSKRQERHDKFIEEVPLLGEAAKKVQYINDPIEREIVNRNLQSINERVNDLTTKITNDPLNYNTYQKELNALKNDVGLNLTSGELSKVQASYNNYERVMKDNEKNPDKQEILNKLLTDWQNDKGSLGKTFDYYKGVDKPDIEKMIEKVKLEPDKYTMINGKWVDKTTGVPMADFAKTYQGAILSDPNYEAYVKHNEFLGRGGYDMSDPNNPMFLPGTEFQGQKYTDQEFDALKKANPTRVKEIESAAKPALIPNPNSGWFGQGLIAEAKAYNQVEKEINPVWKEEAGLAMERAKLAETARSNKAREAQQRANLEFRKQVSGVADANVVSVVDNINSSVVMNNEKSREYSKLFANDYGINLSESDLARFNNGGAANVITEKIKNSKVFDEKAKNNLLSKYSEHQNKLIKQNILATNENYTNLFGKEKANQITKSLTNIIKNGESAIANKPIIHEGVRYEKGLQDPALHAKLGFLKKGEDVVKKDGGFLYFDKTIPGEITPIDNFTINSEKISRKSSDEDGEYTYTQNVKQTINPLSHRAIINNPNKLSEKGGNNYIMMEATSDKGKTITFMIPMEEFHIE